MLPKEMPGPLKLDLHGAIANTSSTSLGRRPNALSIRQAHIDWMNQKLGQLADAHVGREVLEDALPLMILIVDDDFTSRRLLQEWLKGYGSSHIAVNGTEAVEAVRAALESNAPYDLICLDMTMPEMDGNTALQEIRELTQGRGVPFGPKIVMTTALDGVTNVALAYRSQCDGYLVKPITKAKLLKELAKLELIERLPAERLTA